MFSRSFKVLPLITLSYIKFYANFKKLRPDFVSRLSLSMGTHDLRFLCNFFANLRVFLASLISLMMTLSVECFCRFSLAMAQCGFVVVTINPGGGLPYEMDGDARRKF